MDGACPIAFWENDKESIAEGIAKHTKHIHKKTDGILLLVARLQSLQQCIAGTDLLKRSHVHSQ